MRIKRLVWQAANLIGVKLETQTYYERVVRGALAQIAEHLDDALDLSALARGAALSPLHFHRIFRGMVGETPLELQRRLRMERAASSLLNSEASVTTIAFDAGYESHEAFTRAFRQAYAVSPSAYRQPDAADGCLLPRQVELVATSGIHFGKTQHPCFVTQGGNPMNVELKHLDELRVAAVRHRGPYNRISEAFQRLGAIAGPAGLFNGPAAAMLALYYDDPESTPPDELRADAAIAVSPDAVIPQALTEIRIAAGRYACTTHKGSYSQLGDAWARLMGVWLPQSGHRVGAGASFELYRNNPTMVKEEDLVTELYVPIA